MNLFSLPEPVRELPVCAYLDSIVQTLVRSGTLILSAAPGAGKTTLVPPALLNALPGKILLVEPRRVAVRGAADRIAALLGSAVGETAGYAVRGESRSSARTRLLAVTPGVLLRMLLDDPALEGTACVIFDEFHERSLENDLSLALLLEVRESLREDLKLLIMSATLAQESLKALLPEAEVLEIPGREFPVELSYAPPADPGSWLIHASRQLLKMYREAPGDILVFLPGVGEIERMEEMLAGQFPPEARVFALHGSLPLAQQHRVLQALPPGERKIVLATNVAESSLTINGITMVLDSGLERRMRYAPGAGISFLELGQISLASARQRAGRAGRTAPGKACRLWSPARESAMLPFTEPEILSADLSGLVLILARWGTPPEQLHWCDAPPPARLAQAGALLKKLGLLDSGGAITARGKKAAGMPVHPRIGALLLLAQEEGLLPLGAELAGLLEEKDDPARFHSADLRERIFDMRRHPARYRRQCDIRDRLLASFRTPYREQDAEALGLLIAAAWPEWIGRQRVRHGGSYQLANGSGAQLQGEDDLCGSEFLALARVEGGSGRTPAIRLAAPVSREELELAFADRITEEVTGGFDPATERFSARREERLDQLILSSAPCPPPPGLAGKCVLAEALHRGIALPPPEAKGACRLLARLRFAEEKEPERFSGWLSPAFEERLPELAAPWLEGVRSFADLEKLPWGELLRGALSYAQQQELDKLYPDAYRLPSGGEFRLDYSCGMPTLSVRIQELFGLDEHPVIGSRKLPLKLELLSPARRPVQITCDLPGFWRGSWKLVRTEMRGRYPKHSWPEDPLHPDKEK